MLGGTTYPVTINVSAELLCRPSKSSAGECWREYMDRRVLYTASGSFDEVSQKHSPMIVVSF
jgi:hypothetical protein